MVRTDKLRIEEYKKYILENYEYLSLSKMAKNLNISSCKGYSLLKELNLKTKPNRYFVTFSLDDHYFSNINSIDKAYFLGLFFADGNIHMTPTGRKRFQIALHNKDAYILELFKEYLKYTGKLFKDGDSYKLMIHNSTLFDDLNNLGCIERKSLKLTYPTTIPKELESHFIRGFFDGNGSISIYYKSKSPKGDVSFCSTEMFLSTLKEILSEINVKSSPYHKRYKEHEISSGSMSIYLSKTVNRHFYDYLYKDCGDFFLKRKKEKFELVLN